MLGQALDLYGVTLALRKGCRIEGVGTSVRILSPSGATLGLGIHTHAEDSLAHAVALLELGELGDGLSVEQANDYQLCGSGCTRGERSGKCHLAGLRAYGPLDAWMHPPAPIPNAGYRAFAIERGDGAAIRVTLTTTYPALAAFGGEYDAIVCTFQRIGTGPDHLSALVAALDAPEIDTSREG